MKIKKCHILKRIPFGVRFFTFGREDVTKMKRKYRQLAAVLMFLVCLSGCAMSPQKETQKVREASTQAVMEEGVIPGGMPVGIYMETDGVMVLGTDQITGADGKQYQPAENLVRPGDYIVAVSYTHLDVYKRQDMNRLVGTSDMKKIKDLKDRPLLLFTHEWSCLLYTSRCV